MRVFTRCVPMLFLAGCECRGTLPDVVETDADTEVDSDSDSDTDSEFDTEIDSDFDSDTETDTEVDTDTDFDTDTDQDTDSDTLTVEDGSFTFVYSEPPDPPLIVMPDPTSNMFDLGDIDVLYDADVPSTGLVSQVRLEWAERWEGGTWQHGTGSYLTCVLRHESGWYTGDPVLQTTGIMRMPVMSALVEGTGASWTIECGVNPSVFALYTGVLDIAVDFTAPSDLLLGLTTVPGLQSVNVVTYKNGGGVMQPDVFVRIDTDAISSRRTPVAAPAFANRCDYAECYE